MTPERDVDPGPKSQLIAHAPPARTLGGQEGDPIALFQEINERRARIEDAELLRHLRGL